MNPRAVKKLKCRTCGRTFTYTSVQGQPHFPFCSDRCRNVDLGRWFDGEYVIADKIDPDAPPPQGAPPSQGAPPPRGAPPTGSGA